MGSEARQERVEIQGEHIPEWRPGIARREVKALALIRMDETELALRIAEGVACAKRPPDATPEEAFAQVASIAPDGGESFRAAARAAIQYFVDAVNASEDFEARVLQDPAEKQ